jgi:antitoxin ParD1/3/4
MKSWVHGQTRQAGFSTVSEYIRDVLRREQQRLARAEIDEKLLEAVEEGQSAPMTRADWQRLRETGRQKVAVLRKAKKKP